jgi:hypothetical protein
MIKNIYMYLEDEAVDVWRPVQGQHIRDDIYKIISKKHDETENWQFNTGDLVKCVEKIFDDNTKGLVAMNKILKYSSNPRMKRTEGYLVLESWRLSMA